MIELKNQMVQNFLDGFRYVAEVAYQINREKGHHDKKTGDPLRLLLIHSEVSEATEALRDGNPPDDKIPLFTSVEAELADVVIRTMDMGVVSNHRVAEAVLAKLLYNSNRPYRHGRKQQLSEL